jgi:hypothetical protein
MVSIQKNISVLSGVKYSSSKIDSRSAGHVIEKKSALGDFVADATLLFGSEVKADALQSFNDQNAIFHFEKLDDEVKSKLFYSDIPVSELSVDEANELISEYGYFGIAQTSQRIIDFVVQGAGDDVDKLRAGREGVLRGFANAEKAWGGKLPDICCETIDKSIKAIDDKIARLGGNITEITA